MEPKEKLKELQELADKHESLKKEVEYLISEGEKIEDKLKESERIFAITETINSIMEEIEILEEEYNKKLEEK